MSSDLSVKLLLADVDLLEADMARDAAFDSLRERGGLTADEVNDLLDMFEDATNAVGPLTESCIDFEDQIGELEIQLNEAAIISEQRAARIDACRNILFGLIDLLDGPVKKSRVSAKLHDAWKALEP